MNEDTTGVNPLQRIAEIDPEAVGIVADYMTRSAEDTARIEKMVREWDLRELDEWKRRALDAEARLDRIEANFNGLLD